MGDTPWVNTKDLVDTEFKVVDIEKRQYRMWDEVEGKYVYSKTPKKGYMPFWKITLKNGVWTASPAQYSQLLLAAEDGGLADVLDKSFTCSSNGKSGKDVRYWFNLTEK